MIVVDFLGKLRRGILPPQAVLLNYAIGYNVVNRSIYVAAELGIADLLKDGPKSIEQLAEESGANADSLFEKIRRHRDSRKVPIFFKRFSKFGLRQSQSLSPYVCCPCNRLMSG